MSDKCEIDPWGEAHQDQRTYWGIVDEPPTTVTQIEDTEGYTWEVTPDHRWVATGDSEGNVVPVELRRPLAWDDEEFQKFGPFDATGFFLRPVGQISVKREGDPF